MFRQSIREHWGVRRTIAKQSRSREVAQTCCYGDPVEASWYEKCVLARGVSAHREQGAESLAQLHERIIMTFVPVGDDDARMTAICSQASAVRF